MTKRRSIIAIISALLLIVAVGAACMLSLGAKRASALTANDLLSGSSVTIQQNAALPGYMEKIWWNGKEYDSSELTAVRIETDGSATSATVNYGRVIDLSDCDENSRIFDFIVAPASGREFNGNVASVTTADYDFRTLQVTFTDIYDESNYITFDFERRQDFYYYSSIRVSAPGMTSGGWVESSQAMRQSPFGTPLTSSFTGCPANANGQYAVISTFFDYAERAVYAQPYGSLQKTIVRDLDYTGHLLLGESTLWNGFTTGEVRLSFSFQTINPSAKAAIYLFTLNGQDLTGEEIVDTTAPVVKTADENLADGVPEGEVSRPYKIFNTTAYDALDGKLDASQIEVNVLKPDGETSRPIDSDGYFTPDEAGIYTIVWSISDSSGNPGEYRLPVTVRGKLADLQITVENNDLQETYSVGETVNIPQNLTIRGGSGAYKTSISVIDCASDEPLPLTDGTIVFTQQGYYIVAYRAEDYIGNVTMQKYFILAEGRSQPYVEEPSMPTAVLAGKQFVFPEFSATDYNSYAGKPVSADKYYEVTADDWKTTTVYKEGDAFTPSAGTYRYRVCAENIADPSQSYTGDEGSFTAAEAESIGEYLYDPAGKVKADYTASADYPRYIATEDATLEFLNRLSAESFYLTFNVPSELAEYGMIELLVRDYANASQNVTIGILREDGQCGVYLNGERVLSLNAPFTGTTFEVYFSNGYAYINATLLGELGEDMFSSGLVYLSVSMKDVSGTAGFELRRINNQTYLGLFDEGENFDLTAPVVVPSEDIELIKYVGDSIVIPSAKAYDVLDPVSTISLRVMRNEEQIYQQNGAEGTVIFADLPGEYMIVYTASDSSGNTASATYTVKVINRASPAINVQGSLPAQTSVGGTVKIPQAEASDFAGNALEVFVYVIDADNYMQQAADSFVAEKAGTYIVRYYCYDAYGCYTIRDYTIAVIGGGK